jgi:hypothetical protein
LKYAKLLKRGELLGSRHEFRNDNFERGVQGGLELWDGEYLLEYYWNLIMLNHTIMKIHIIDDFGPRGHAQINRSFSEFLLGEKKTHMVSHETILEPNSWVNIHQKYVLFRQQ